MLPTKTEMATAAANASRLTGNDRPAVDVHRAVRGTPGLKPPAKRHLLGLIDQLLR